MEIERARVTVVDKIYYQQHGDQPIVVDVAFSKDLKASEQPYVRKTSADESWKPLDCGWIDSVGIVHITNVNGAFPAVIPSEKEVEEARKKILEIRYQDSECCFLIPPGECIRLSPSHAAQLRIRSRHGTTKYVIRVFSK
jgi:hypothetical protein